MLSKRKIPVPSIGSNFGNIKFRRGTIHSIPIVCILALLLLGMGIINPIVRSDDRAYADEPLALSTGDPAVSMSVTSGAVSGATNAETGKVAYRTNNIRVVANNIDGYQVYVQAADGSTGNLVGETSKITIAGVGSNVSPTNFSDNSWGYALATTASANAETLAYNTVPENGATTMAAYSTDASTETKDFTLAFAAKFGEGAQADHYKTNVLLSVAAGAKEVVNLGFAGIEYMQDMTSAVCSNAEADAEGRLIDNRDGNVYWVMKVGAQCWMMQNLAYNLSAKEGTEVKVISEWGDSYANTSRYYNPGDGMIYATPLVDDSCTTTAQLSECMSGHGWMSSLSDGLVTYDANFINSTQYLSMNDNSVICFKEAGSVFGDMSSHHMGCRVYYYEANHYLVGNYYTYAGASRACPVGWKIPTGNTASSVNPDSDYSILVNKIAETENHSLVKPPYYFTKGGRIDNSTLLSAGAMGTYMTSTTNGGGKACLSVTGIGNVSGGASVMSGAGWGAGYSLRCIAQ